MSGPEWAIGAAACVLAAGFLVLVAAFCMGQDWLRRAGGCPPCTTGRGRYCTCVERCKSQRCTAGNVRLR